MFRFGLNYAKKSDAGDLTVSPFRRILCGIKSMAKSAKRSYPNLKTWRGARSQHEVAAILGVSQTTYSRWERGVRVAKRGELRVLLEKTGVPLEVLTGVVA